jgi:hypothetical protein
VARDTASAGSAPRGASRAKSYARIRCIRVTPRLSPGVSATCWGSPGYILRPAGSKCACGRTPGVRWRGWSRVTVGVAWSSCQARHAGRLTRWRRASRPGRGWGTSAAHAVRGRRGARAFAPRARDRCGPREALERRRGRTAHSCDRRRSREPPVGDERSRYVCASTRDALSGGRGVVGERRRSERGWHRARA